MENIIPKNRRFCTTSKVIGFCLASYALYSYLNSNVNQPLDSEKVDKGKEVGSEELEEANDDDTDLMTSLLYIFYMN